MIEPRFDDQDLFLVGISIDLLGGFLLGRGLLSRSQDVVRRAMHFPTLNHEAIVADVRDGTDAVMGLACLLIGFLTQAVGYWLSLEQPTTPVAPDVVRHHGLERAATGLILGLVAVGALILVRRPLMPRLRKRRLIRIARVKPETGAIMANVDTSMLCELGRASGAMSEVGEDDAAYCKRVFGTSA
jgi:hypothetical protein